MNGAFFAHPVYPELLIASVALLVAGAVCRRRVVAWFGERWAASAGFAGALAGVLIGTLANDSGSVLLVLGTICLAVSAGYYRVRSPDPTATRTHRVPSLVRVAIVTPYSWTYPGGVNRHVDALAGELIARGHELRVLAPYDPPDRLGRLLHRADPRPAELPDYLIPLGRTKAFGANGSVSNLGVFPDGVTKMRRELRAGRPRRRPRARTARRLAELGRVLLPRRPGGRHLPRLLDEAAAQPRRHARRSAAQVQPAPRPDRGLGGRRLDRASAGSAASTT